MKYLLILLLILTACGACGSLPQDPTPAFDLAGRFALPMKNDCNIGRNNIGLSGCVFRQGQIGGNLILPSLWSGDFALTSYNCKNISASVASNADLTLQLRDMYNAMNNQNCSFQITRTIKEKNMVADNTILGRFFIKIIPNDPFYSALKFSVGNNYFNGVGWFQGKGQEIVLNFTPETARGTLYITCGNDEIIRRQYNSNNFAVSFQTSRACDYEINAVNYDSGIKELGTFILEIPKPTIDLSRPLVTIKGKNISFTFPDKDKSNRKAVVFGVIVDKTKCIKSNSCTVTNSKDSYVVQGFTPSLRAFYGVYSITAGKWEVY